MRILLGFLLMVMLAATFVVTAFSQTAPSFDRNSVTAELVITTAKIYPVDDLINKTEGSIKSNIAKMREGLKNGINSDIDQNENFDDAQREKKKKETEIFLTDFCADAERVFRRGLNVKGWVDQGLTDIFDNDFSEAEIKELHKFLTSKNGKIFIAVFEEQMNASRDNREAVDDPKAETPEFEAAFEDFMGSTLGTKYFAAYTKTLSDSLLKNTEEWGKQLFINIDIEMESGLLGKKLDAFKVQVGKID